MKATLLANTVRRLARQDGSMATLARVSSAALCWTRSTSMRARHDWSARSLIEGPTIWKIAMGLWLTDFST